MAGYNPKLGLFDEVYNTDTHTSINYLSAGKLSQSDVLTTAVVQLYGLRSGKFPLYLATKGRGAVNKITKSADGTFQVPIMGKPKKSSTVGKTIYSASDKIGVGKSEFYIYFVDRWMQKGATLETNKKNKVYVTQDPVQEGDYYKYTCQLSGSDPTKYISVSEISVGAKLATMFKAVGLINSRGKEGRSQTVARMVNQTAFLRDSYQWKGNVGNKVMNISLPTVGGGTTTSWMEWEMFQHELSFLEECENYLWYSEYNKNSDGLILDKDADTGETRPEGAGLLEQIPNSSTYGILTKDKIKTVVRNVMYNSGADNIKDIKLFTGIGGQEAFSDAFMAESAALGYQFNASNKVIGGATNSRDLTYGAYFGTFKHVDGHTVTIEKLPLLDMGSRADIAPRHPITGLPMTSYDMYFVDMSTINGQANVQYIQEAGREDIRKKVNGLNSKDSDTISTDADVSAVHMAKSIGIHLLNPTNSFKLTCNLS